jgi:hypothetical protein
MPIRKFDLPVLSKRQLDAMHDEDQRAYWVALFNAWAPSAKQLAMRQIEYQADHDDTMRDDEWTWQ